jgi:hypothetical protein
MNPVNGHCGGASLGDDIPCYRGSEKTGLRRRGNSRSAQIIHFDKKANYLCDELKNPLKVEA